MCNLVYMGVTVPLSLCIEPKDPTLGSIYKESETVTYMCRMQASCYTGSKQGNAAKRGVALESTCLH